MSGFETSAFETQYRAMASRDQRFDGHFVVAVTSTSIYCRPSCPSRTPHRPNVRFYRVPAAAEAAGFRACRRCRPDVAPSAPDWNVRGDLAARALRLIVGGVVDEVGVAGLARRLSVSQRHLHRQLVAEVGVGPQALAITRRAQVARLLIESSPLPLADLAFAAGYASVRQFNDGVRAAFGCAPGELRRRRPVGAATAGDLDLELRYRPPLESGLLLDWLAARALPGIEQVEPGRYSRTLRLPHGTGFADVRLGDAGTSAATVRLSLSDLRDVTAAVARCREIFDLDADPAAIADDLRADPVLGRLVTSRPGLRVPGCADGFELAVRAVLGQRRSLGSARTLGARLVARFGEPLDTHSPALTHLFPDPDTLADADLESIGVNAPLAATLRGLARAVKAGGLGLDRGVDRRDCVAALRALAGIGARAAEHIATHALGDPDVLGHHDPVLIAAARSLGIADDADGLGARARQWRPWRSYAATYLNAAALIS